jgi:hypothetical protein
MHLSKERNEVDVKYQVLLESTNCEYCRLHYDFVTKCTVVSIIFTHESENEK